MTKGATVQSTNREITIKNQCVRSLFELRLLLPNLLTVTAVGLLLGFLAPFGSGNAAPLRVYGYWLTVCLVGYWVYAPLVLASDQFTLRYLKHLWLRVALGALMASVVMAALVPLLTSGFFSTTLFWPNHFFNALPQTIVIGGVITLITFAREQLQSQKLRLQESAQLIASHTQIMQHNESTGAEQILRNLPHQKRGKLLALETDDHYLKVYTDKGDHLVLMRLKDALLILKDYPGVQIHRSWWVAEQAVTGVKKVNRKTLLVLSNNKEAPVSRTYAEQVKERGWI